MKIIQRIQKLIQQIAQQNKSNPSKAMIYSTSQEHLANLLIVKLKANDIEAVILNQKDSMYNAFGLFEIYVKADDVVRAKYIIDKDNE
jgi:hypothetical protein